MKDSATIKQFYFDFAQYNVSDGLGDIVQLRVFYKENRYEMLPFGMSINNQFRLDVAKFAEDMLRRKHNTNFAAR